MKKMETIKKKIIYRSEYRGIKEMDLLLGGFVKKYVNKFTYEELIDLYEILKKDDDTIFKWYLGTVSRDIIPENKVSNLLKNFKL